MTGVSVISERWTTETAKALDRLEHLDLTQTELAAETTGLLLKRVREGLASGALRPSKPLLARVLRRRK